MQDVLSLTIRQFGSFLEEIGNVVKMENGGDDDNSEQQKKKNVSLTGKQGAALAKKLFPRG